MKFWYVAKMKIYSGNAGQTTAYYSDLSCETKPCRVNPNDNNLGLWLEGVDNGLKLDLVQTGQAVGGGKLLRLEAR